jgi:hypothetical protein
MQLLLLLLLLLPAPSLPLPPSLSPSTVWDLRVSFLPSSVPTLAGRPVPACSFTLPVVFSPEAGYEPPQGELLAWAPPSSPSPAPPFSFVSCSFKLSEDPADRKDGLWVWGLFKDPLYPFLLLKLDARDAPLTAARDAEVLPGMTYYAQLGHRMSGEGGGAERGSLKAPRGVDLAGADLVIRRPSVVKADLVGLARAEVYDEKVVGKVEICNPRSVEAARIGAVP